jgi:hypothetical protein
MGQAAQDSVRPAKRARGSSSSSRPSPTEEAALRVQAAFRGFRSRSTGQSLAQRRRDRDATRAAEAEGAQAAALAVRARSAEYRQLARHCPDADPLKLAAVDVALESLVGLQPLKDYCRAARRDCLARAALGDPPLVRNVLISGNLGTGKKLAADLLSRLLRALGVAKGMSPTTTTLEQMALDVRRDMSCVIIDGLDKIESARHRVDAILNNFPNHCFIFVGPTDKVEALHGGVPHFRKVDPAWLQLPNYSSSELAAIASAKMSARGYSLAAGLGTRDIQSALSATWARDVLAMRNAHLSGELVERAMSARNRRLPMASLLAQPPTLHASDLGLASEGLDSLLAERACVDREIGALVGMGSLKAALAELRAKVEFVGRGADPRLLEGCLNVVLTGNPGAGKTTAARLLFRALRSLGLLKSNVFVERNALELKGTHVGWTCPQVKEMVQAALGGCLFLDEAYALSGSGVHGDRGDSFADEALRTLLTETENNRTSLCVVLAGYREAMDGLMRADPGLRRRFPTTIHLDDYSPAELAAIAKQTADSRFGLAFAPGLERALALHIRSKHGHEIALHNASLAVALVEAAINRLAVRCVGLGGVGRAPSPGDASMPASPASVAVAAAAAAGAQGPSGAGVASVLTTLVPSDFLIEPGVAEAAEAQPDPPDASSSSDASPSGARPAGGAAAAATAAAAAAAAAGGKACLPTRPEASLETDGGSSPPLSVG